MSYRPVSLSGLAALLTFAVSAQAEDIPALAPASCTTATTDCGGALYQHAAQKINAFYANVEQQQACCTPATPAATCTPAEESCAENSCTQTACEGEETGFCKEEHSIMKLFGNNDPGFTIGGWAQYGYHSDDNGLFFDNTSGFGSNQRWNLHQGWLFAERVADGSKGFDWGFRVDVMYGTDADDTIAFGNAPNPTWDNNPSFAHGIYGIAIPQAYAEVAFGNVSVKAGHFYTLIGYEVVTAPDNFFFSHAYTMFNNEPFTHTGVLSTIEASDNLTIYAGWTLGWDTGFDQVGGGSNFLGGAAVQLSDNLSVTYICTAGNFGNRLGTIGVQGYSHSVVIDAKISEKLNYVLQSDFVDTNAVSPIPGARDQAYSVNNYMFYSINEWLAVGGRFEWFRSGGVSVYEATAGVNIKPGKNIIIRPEVRHDWSPGFVAGGFAARDDFTTFACDFIVKF